MSDDQVHTSADTATQVFLDHRELLFAVAYNMLGTVADTEDVLQETWLSWAARAGRAGRSTATESPHAGSGPSAPIPVIENPRAYLVRIAVNHALARRASISRRRETYIGPWLPEPVVTDSGADSPGTADASDHALRTESVSLALLVVLETLSPLERAVFVLNEVFGYAHTEIADILDRSPSAVRKIAHRARGHVHARRPRYRTHPRVQRQVTEQFVAATLGGDIRSLMEILAPDATMWTDGGGRTRSAVRPIRGRDKVARALTGYASRSTTGLEFQHRSVNGDASVVVFEGDSPYAVMVMDLDPDSGQVSGVYLVTNPDKLSGVHLDDAGAF
ncbi:sigma factor-like helix-turn-helix DNA-binding protein [Streptomyces sp. TP-A0356]|uniref:sigma factor-like helix-turn-helix DNA-binding protein n=1 Tax=Streptomyces sp. TP-A0356 TaxID=1359208 RepID=UPI0006E41DF4|nr:sigma factor-like helix-turn-helix DNA-binding protein [Streptomyces sp. TP-A0356]